MWKSILSLSHPTPARNTNFHLSRTTLRKMKRSREFSCLRLKGASSPQEKGMLTQSYLKSQVSQQWPLNRLRLTMNKRKTSVSLTWSLRRRWIWIKETKTQSWLPEDWSRRKGFRICNRRTVKTIRICIILWISFRHKRYRTKWLLKIIVWVARWIRTFKLILTTRSIIEFVQIYNIINLYVHKSSSSSSKSKFFWIAHWQNSSKRITPPALRSISFHIDSGFDMSMPHLSITFLAVTNSLKVILLS